MARTMVRADGSNQIDPVKMIAVRLAYVIIGAAGGAVVVAATAALIYSN